MPSCKTILSAILLLSSLLSVNACSQSTNTVTYSGATEETDEEVANTSTDNTSDGVSVSNIAEEAIYPKQVTVGDQSLIIHPPQILSWDEFESLEGIAALESIPEANEEPRYGVIHFTADAIPDLETRTVAISNLQVSSISADNQELPLETRQLFESAFPAARVIPLDLALSHVADTISPESTTDIISEPPVIFISKSSAVLVLIHGEPVLVPVEDLELQFVANTNWAMFFHPVDEKWYLQNDDTWLSADAYTGPWNWANDLPSEFDQLPENSNWESARRTASQWTQAPAFSAPKVFSSTIPAEMILFVGEPNLVEIVDELSYANNTDSQLFNTADTWYYLVSGRWFKNDDLDSGWEATIELPEVFANIPTEHSMGNALASVPGTLESKIAVLDAQIPTKTTLPLITELPELVTYTGEPQFVEIIGTNLMRAANTDFDVILDGTVYYLCYTGTWYEAVTANGPWNPASEVPDSIYTIPASDPAYKVTYVQIASSTPSTVTYSSTAGYSSNVHVYFGMSVWGSGYYYPPYMFYHLGYPHYYRYPYSYGSGSFYNPNTGAYGSVSRAYGPYGGWGYASAYNPNTGSYGRAESVWDYDEWWGAGEAYNPNSGNYFATERYYDADDGDWEVDSRFETGRGTVDISREFDGDSGVATIQTSRGGEGTYTRRASDGGWDTGGEYTTADGRTITSSGRYEDGRGTSNFTGSDGGTGSIDRAGNRQTAARQGEFTRGDQTLTTDTVRDGVNSRTEFETSGGAQGVSSRNGLEGRTTVVESGSGDVYASRDGNVYKRGEDGWSELSGSGANSASASARAETARTNSTTNSNLNSRPETSNTNTSAQRQSIVNRNQSQSLNRQYQSRSTGMNRSAQYQQRSRGAAGRGRRR